MNKVKKYFENLPLSFKSAAIATLMVTALVILQSFIMVSKMKMHSWDADQIVFPVLNYSIWLILAPLLYLLIIKVLNLKKGNPSWQKKNLLLIGLSVGFTIGHEAIGVTVYSVIYALTHIDELTRGMVPFKISAGIFGLTQTFFEFWIIYFVLLNFHNKKKVRLIELKNSQLETDLLKAQMSALKNQLHPHFLFNSFNTISSLMDENIELAQRMISKLGTLLRTILKDGDRQFISVREEVALAKLYLEVEQIRFMGRLVTRFDIDPSAEAVMVPTLLLQPIIENAVKHGFYKKVGECEISIKISMGKDYLIFEVSDNGAGMKNSSAFSFGIGLKNTEERLYRCYGDHYKLTIDPEHQDGGFCTEIKILKEALNNENIDSIN